jgi:hypothetical protein
MTVEVVLVHPPFWDMYGPPASTAALLGYLRANSVAARQIDLNQKYFTSRYAALVEGSLADLTDRDSFEAKVPHEHKVVLGLRDFTPDPLAACGLDEARLNPASHRQAIATWDTPRLNAWDAIIHYGYFVRHDPCVAELLEDPAALRQPGWQPLKQLFDASCLPIIRQEQPAVVGFSLLGEQQLAATIACTRWLRDCGYEGVVVWGGSDIRYTHEKLTRPGCWWRTLPDVLCLGEGESALLQLVRRCLDARQTMGSGWRTAVRLSRHPKDSQFIAGMIGQPFQHDLLPVKKFEQVSTLAHYDFDGFDLHEGYLMPWPVVPYQGSRGCHWGICAFCDHEEGYRLHYRPKVAAQVVDHMEHLEQAFGVTHLQFVDEAIEPQWLADLNEEIDRRALSGRFRWSNYSKIAKEVTPDLLAHSHRNGCRLILFGVESFNQRLLNVIRKGIRRSEVFRTLHDAHAAGIRSWIWLISGLPTETPEELRRNIEDLRSLRGVVDAVSVNRYRISANSDIFREVEKFGIVSYDLNSPMDVVFRSDGALVDPTELARIFYQEYYPTAVEMSVSHNRYLLFAEAIKAESIQPGAGRGPTGLLPGKGTWRDDAARQTSAQAGLGNL